MTTLRPLSQGFFLSFEQRRKMGERTNRNNNEELRSDLGAHVTTKIITRARAVANIAVSSSNTELLDFISL